MEGFFLGGGMHRKILNLRFGILHEVKGTHKGNQKVQSRISELVRRMGRGRSQILDFTFQIETWKKYGNYTTSVSHSISVI